MVMVGLGFGPLAPSKLPTWMRHLSVPKSIKKESDGQLFPKKTLCPFSSGWPSHPIKCDHVGVIYFIFCDVKDMGSFVKSNRLYQPELQKETVVEYLLFIQQI